MNAVTFHIIWTLVLFICIVGVIIWAYSSRQKAAFKEAANLVFDDEKNDKTGENKQ